MLRFLPLRLNLRLWHGEQSPGEFGHPLELFARRWLAAWLWGHRRRFPRKRWRLLLALRRSGAQIGADQVAIGESPSHNVSQHADEPSAVIALALIEAAHLLINITRQMERVHADVGAFDRSLQKAPEVLQAVGMDLPPDVLLGMVDHLMLIHLRELALPVLLGGVGVEVRALLDPRQDVPPDTALIQILRDGGAHARGLPIPAALQETQDGSLVHAASPANDATPLALVHELGCASDEGLVGLDRAFHLGEAPALHGAPDAVIHEPSSRLRDAERPPQFVRADAVLGIDERPDRREPLVQADGAILEDRSELHRELPSTVAALPDAAGLEEAGISRVTGRTGDAVRPTQRDEEGERHVFVCEVMDRFVERVGKMLGLGHDRKLLQGAWCVNCVIALTSA